MPKMDGFQLLSQLNFRKFDLVITTAYDNYAIQAFKESAIDYLLKPIDSDDLQKVARKITANKSDNNLGTELKLALENIYKQQNSSLNKVALPLNRKIVFVNASDIIYCKSDGNYTTIYLTNNEKHLISKKLKDVMELINDKQIIKVHQSYLVNITYIKEYVKSDGYYLVLDDKTTIPVSKSNRRFLLESIQNV